jgi:ribosomal protein S12 methylthiotransferase
VSSFYLESLGCAKNQVDSEALIAELVAGGNTWVEAPENADLIVVNTCAFIESAKRESIDTILRLRELNKRAKISVRGCLAERYGQELKVILPEADEIAGFRRDGEKSSPASPGSRPLLSLPGSAYVKISEGCNNRCSFCAIPNIRGPLKSRGKAEIVEECRALIARGVKELCVIAQDAGSYGLESAKIPLKTAPLVDLLTEISRLDGDFWLRVLYIHPDRLIDPSFSLLDGLLSLQKADSRIMHYFDLPFQHASKKILQSLGRVGSAGRYLELLEKIRRTLPLATIRSTFLVGFPGETEEDFNDLREFQQKARIDWLGIFPYSREEDTPAYSMKGRPSKNTANLRKSLLEEAQLEITEGQLRSRVENLKKAGRKPVFALVEEENLPPNDGEDGVYIGRLEFEAPEVDGACVIYSDRALQAGAMAPVEPLHSTGVDVFARAV